MAKKLGDHLSALTGVFAQCEACLAGTPHFKGGFLGAFCQGAPTVEWLGLPVIPYAF